jgi:hypothetical protein
MQCGYLFPFECVLMLLIVIFCVTDIKKEKLVSAGFCSTIFKQYLTVNTSDELLHVGQVQYCKSLLQGRSVCSLITTLPNCLVCRLF